MTQWADLRAHVIACTGWTWGEVGTLTLPRLRALSRYWSQHPPVHLLVAAYLGYKPDPADQPEAAAGDGGDASTPIDWLGGGAQFPASAELSAASTPAEALAAAERMFYGTVLEFPSS